MCRACWMAQLLAARPYGWVRPDMDRRRTWLATGVRLLTPKMNFGCAWRLLGRTAMRSTDYLWLTGHGRSYASRLRFGPLIYGKCLPQRQ